MISPPVIDAAGVAAAVPPQRVWYTSYGSNTDRARLAHYITGGRPPGATREYPGCRDRRLPERSLPVEITGSMYFATESSVWTGGRAFLDPDAKGRVLARAHLVTAQQFSDIAAQEMYREPGTDLDLGEVLSLGHAVLGNGRYETLVCPGVLDGAPMLTFTAPWSVDDVELNAPSAPYLTVLTRGLLAAGAWELATIAEYVAACPGASGHWTEREIRELVAA
ncbi:hypothetical protein GCM10011583_62060 [Streptomyces camponoticapitis]|uniref:Histone deacetylase n=1 Tax=Streptomyces camponoticapitis TaxID=1616125 RepID=A0ABQ2ER19_9ACTN|nr:histone deacetylase [Streptomyces camponoticapitis]GGK21647.1 hypothetical protein GCM10011583_62060 [Streptomyces camponoticapitis]